MIIGVIVSAFLITLLEAVCTGQVYLPVIALMLKSGQQVGSSLLYLMWYNLIFVMPLLLICFLVYAGATSDNLSAWLKQNNLILKMLLSGLFLFFTIVFTKLVF